MRKKKTRPRPPLAPAEPLLREIQRVLDLVKPVYAEESETKYDGYQPVKVRQPVGGLILERERFTPTVENADTGDIAAVVVASNTSQEPAHDCRATVYVAAGLAKKQHAGIAFGVIPPGERRTQNVSIRRTVSNVGVALQVDFSFTDATGVGWYRGVDGRLKHLGFAVAAGELQQRLTAWVGGDDMPWWRVLRRLRRWRRSRLEVTAELLARVEEETRPK
jgi:hypothetical protein